MILSHRLLLLPLAGLSLLLCSCAVDTPKTRIERNPGTYQSLSTRHQDLVEHGRIEKGMPKKGVLLALGTPDGKAEGFRNGSDYERWTYNSLRPVYNQHFYGSYSLGGHGYHGRGYGLGFGPSIEYIPTRSATVWFRGDKVDSWDRVAP